MVLISSSNYHQESYEAHLRKCQTNPLRTISDLVLLSAFLVPLQFCVKIPYLMPSFMGPQGFISIEGNQNLCFISCWHIGQTLSPVSQHAETWRGEYTSV